MLSVSKMHLVSLLSSLSISCLIYEVLEQRARLPDSQAPPPPTPPRGFLLFLLFSAVLELESVLPW